MTAKEWESYIMEHDNARRREIPEWKYIRYTVFETLFASIRAQKEKLILTVWGKFPQYESAYSTAIGAAQAHEPLHYTDIILDNSVPEHVIKSMIDSSYREKLFGIIAPKAASGDYNHVPYSGVIPDENGEYHYENNPLSVEAEIAATAHYTHVTPPDTSDLPKLIGMGKWDFVPYRATQSIEEIRKYIALRKALEKGDKQRRKNPKKTT